MKTMLGKLKDGLKKTRKGIVDKIGAVISSRNEIDDELFDELEEILISGDVGVNISLKLIEEVKAKVTDLGISQPDNIITFLKSAVKRILSTDDTTQSESFFNISTKPYVIMVIGVNGTGKTTTIGKLAHQFKQENKKILIAAADTFRAAASEQLEIWAQRAGVDIIRNQPGADPAAVAFDSLQAAMNRDVDVLIIDTAGRLHTKTNLMEELKKIRRVLTKLMDTAPHETLLVMDATTGQNGLSQARQFTEAIGVTGIVLTKLDGTAKGGMVLAIRDELGVPVRFVGIGEKIGDLQPFDPVEFVEALFQ